MKRSLQRRLSLMLGGAILLSGLVAAAASFILAYGEAKEFQDDMLRQTALLVTRNIGISTQIGARDKNRAGVTLGNSESRISVIRLPSDPRPDWLTGDLASGFHTLAAGGERLRLFVRKDTPGKTTVVAQPTDTRDEIAMNSALRTLVPLLLLLPVMTWLIVRIVRSELAPVNDLTSHLDAQPADRPRPLSDEEVPDEITPFVHAINRLLKRVSDLMSQQRRFIADAAHELRSPLTALSIQAQNLKQAGSLENMRERILPLQAGIERARQLTEQLLSLARTQAGALETTDVDVSTMARELIAEYLPMAEAKGIDLGLDEAAPLMLSAAPETLRLVLKNALENGLKYVPEGGEVTLRLYSDDASAIIEIVDNGPGIPVSERKRVFDPFYRLPEATSEGSGLGLAIAAEASASLGGCVSLLDRPEGCGLVFRYRQGR
ncbi:histidine kinase [Rugosibacter aromaticivorans]|uniref:histidine kinase n=1 Tax=Rugosibacter aromaticivorans TaxID=1565605 RepID=A0A0C5J770_9PROT|nr:ATP-binding protein [Rugosibacter aromaticivorans]AJP47558.1 histidine kinase [Rugosibacter aromaticivorans]TBR13455.1 MAG: two-component sensor histidine kinase [Rugosibacter sp.]